MNYMNERQHLELVQRNDIYIKVGTGYRLITDKRDGSGNLIDLGYNLYTTPNLGDQYIKFLPGPKGDIVLPAGVTPLPPIQESVSKQLGRGADQALGTMANLGGCAARGCMWYIVILIALNLLFGLFMFVCKWH